MILHRLASTVVKCCSIIFVLWHLSGCVCIGQLPIEALQLIADSCAEQLQSQPVSPPATNADRHLPVNSTRKWITFKRPPDAIELIGPIRSLLIPENSEIASKWTFEDGTLTASPKWDSVITPNSYRDFQMHIEFNVNEAGDVEHERNGNSGVYLQLRYELQILNSYKVPFESFGKIDCGCIYQMKKPDRFACLPAGEWQSFDIAFRSARYQDGKKTENARLTVYQNQVLIHDDFVLPRHTGAGKKEGPEPLPVKLQGHHNQVRFRNFWIQNITADN